MTAEEVTLTILKWFFIVFVAGFIGYFGRYLSKLILGRLHKKGPHGRHARPAFHEVVKAEQEYKLQKKKLKLQKKKTKIEKLEPEVPNPRNKVSRKKAKGKKKKPKPKKKK